MSETYGGWEQAENSDYDEQKPTSGDSHEDEFDDEYSEQQPKGPTDHPDITVGAGRFEADVEYWEEVARLNALAKPYDPAVQATSEAAALNSVARPYDPNAPVTSDAAAVSPFAEKLTDNSSVSLSSKLSSPNPDDFDWADSVDPAGPPVPGTAATGPNVASEMSFDPLGESSDGSPFQAGSLDQFEAEDVYQPAIVDPGAPYADGDSDSFSLSSQTDAPPNQYVVDDSYEAPAEGPSFAPEVEYQPDISQQTDWDHFIG